MRIFVVVGLCAILGGCGLVAAKQREEEFARARAQADGIFAECDAKIPKEKGQIVNRTRCRAPGFSLLRNFAPYPDLMDQEAAYRMAMAERIDAGQITMAQAELEAAENRSRLIAEEQRRSLSNRAVSAQESVAAAQWRASAPVSCTRIGNTTNCY